MKIVRIAITLWFLCLLAQEVFGQVKVTADEYAIYAAVLSDINKDLNEHPDNQISSFVIVRETSLPDSWKNIKLEPFEAKFLTTNKKSSLLESRFPTQIKIILIANSELQSILDADEERWTKLRQNRLRSIGPCGPAWGGFFEKFPNTVGFHRFSKIGFNSKKNRALVVVEEKGESSGYEYDYYLKRSRRGWTITQKSGGGGVC